MPQINFQNVSAQPRRSARVHRIRPTILVAEDSSDSREMMRMLLRLKGYQVIVAENGPKALEAALVNHPDLILVDMQLPKLDGLGVTRNLRCHSQFKDTPIIMVSGHDPVPHKQEALDAGCTDYLLKPIDFDRLDAILKRNVPLRGQRSESTYSR